MHMRIGIGLHVEAEAILHTGIEAFDKDMPHLPGAVGVGIEGILGKGTLGSRLQQNQRARRRMFGKNGEVDSRAAQRCAQRKRNSTVDAIGSDRSRGRFVAADFG